MKAIAGIKKGMSQVYDENDQAVPVTVIDTNDCVVSMVDKHGYEVGVGKNTKAKNSLVGKYKDLGFVPKYTAWVSEETEMKVGDEVNPEDLKDLAVKITGVSKGKGFAGVVKRWGFAGGPKTHGQSDRLRAPGSIGAGTDPGRVLKGKKMPGRMGSDVVTIRNKDIVDVVDGFILIKGSVPGNKGGLVVIKEQK